ncbi:hypothetical protein BX666DRAFT_2121523 [Dichotomocladium elegans]|nr:hypothetical protein BX666DRAFT_2121523 [Dichotomocladium elegans]
MSTSETLDMQSQLAYAELLYRQIQNDNARLIEERDILRKDLEASRSELMLAMSAVASEEAARCNVGQVFEAQHTECQNLLAQVATTRKKLNASRDRNKILCRQSRRLNSKLTEEISKHRRSEMDELQDKNAIWVLENQVNGLVAQNCQTSKELQDTQEKNRQLEEFYRESTYKLTSEKDAIARENETLRLRISELSQQAKDSSSRADMATRRFEKARREHHRVRNQLNKMRAVYKSSVNTYKMSAASSNGELKHVKAALEETKLIAQDTQRKQDLTTQLAEQLKSTVEQEQKQHADDCNTIVSLETKVSELNNELIITRTTAFYTEGRLKNAELQLIKDKKHWKNVGVTLQKNLASTKEHISKLIRIHRDTLSNLTEKQLSGMPSNPSAFLELAKRTTVQLHETLSTFTAENSHCYSRWKAALDPSERDKKYVEDIDKNMKRMHEEIECLWKENYELEDKYASMLTASAVSDNQIQNEKLQRLCDDLENQTKTLSTQLVTKQTELEECHARINSLEADVKRHSDTTQQLKRSVQDWTTRPLGLLSMLNIQRPDLTESPAVLKENQPPKASLVTTQDERPTANAQTGEPSKMKEVLTELNKIKRQNRTFTEIKACSRKMASPTTNSTALSLETTSHGLSDNGRINNEDGKPYTL